MRSRWISRSALLAASALWLVPLHAGENSRRAALTAHVDPFIGTAPSNSPNPVPGGAGGSTIPGAMVPFGMVQPSPDTPGASPSGYGYLDSRIESFGMTHFNGAGCPNKEDIPILPVTGELDASPGTHWANYASPFTHGTESASPGFYQVRLDRYGIQVAVTATARTGFFRFVFPATRSARVLIDASRNATGERSGSIQIDDTGRVSGTFTGGGFCGGKTYTIHFAAEFDRPFTGSGTWLGDRISDGSRATSGVRSGAVLTFDTTERAAVQMKMALSYVSLANARANLAAEIPAWEFEAVRAAADSAWNAVLRRAVVTGGPQEDQEKFYTALYHVFSNPNVFGDVNGEYMGFDDVVHTVQNGTNYQNYSGWDVYRSWIQLVSILAPETPEFVRSMLAAGREGGLLPKWSDVHREDNVMVGDPGPVIVASAHAFGVRGFDTAEALRLMHRAGSDPAAAMQGEVLRSGLAGWIRDRYYAGNAAIALEYAQADFAVAQFARALGDAGLHGAYMARAQNWKNQWNPASRSIHPRNEEGWLAPFDPARGTGFIEGNAAQYTWMVPFNLRALIDRMGGDAAAVARLDTLFLELNAGIERPHFYIGNEPQFATPWAYAFAGAPWKTQEVVRRVVSQSFNATPGGLPGNDDLGATSSWLVWAYLGLYPAIPGTDVLVLHGPVFESAMLQLANGKTLRIEGRGAGPDRPYVQSLRVNGVPTTRSWLRWSDLAGGGTLEFTMGDRPNPRWGSDPADRPPSDDTGGDPAPPPAAASAPLVRPSGINVALHRPAAADGVCGPTEGPEKAFNGSTSGGNSDKWCSLGRSKWLQVDLGASFQINGFVLKHAGAGWESPEWNTKDFNLQLSADGSRWATVVRVTGNAAGITSHPITPATARWVRLNVTTPENCCGTGAARIYELEVYADEK